MSSQGDYALCLESLWSNNSSTTASNNSNALGSCVPCGHVLHKECYAKWQASSYFRDACPFCAEEEVEFMPLFLNFPTVTTAADVKSSSVNMVGEEAKERTMPHENNESSEASLRSKDSRSPPTSTSTLSSSSSPVEEVRVRIGIPAPACSHRLGRYLRASRQTRTTTTTGGGLQTTGNPEALVQPGTLRSGRRLVAPNSTVTVANSTTITATTAGPVLRRRRKRRRQDVGRDNVAFPDVCLELWDALVGSQETTTTTTATAEDSLALPRRSRRNVVRRET